MDYESKKLLSEYLLMHYGSHDERMPWGIGRLSAIDFPAVTAAMFTQKRVDLTLDLGCAVGAASFHLSKTSKKVIGLDQSKTFIDAANKLKSTGRLKYSYQEDGLNFIDSEAVIPSGAKSEKVSFAVADVMKLPDGFKGFDRVHASNLLCRLERPKQFLESLARLLNKDGELVLASPFSWSEEFTPQENWPTGDSWAWLQQCLSKDFVCLGHADEMFIIREHLRKFQLGVSKVSKWRRK